MNDIKINGTETLSSENKSEFRTEYTRKEEKHWCYSKTAILDFKILLPDHI